MKKFIVARTLGRLDGAMKRVLMGLAACLLSTAAYSANFYDDRKHPEDTIWITNDIKEGDDVTLKSILLQRLNEGKVTKYVFLDSPGGYLDPAYQMALTIRTLELETAVGPDRSCVSACMILLAGGKSRFVAESARLGVHSTTATRKADGAEVEDGNGTLEMLRFMKNLGTPANVLGIIATTHNTEIAWLKASDTYGWIDVIPQTPTSYAPPTPIPPSMQQQKTNSDLSHMICRSVTSGNVYDVHWWSDNTIQIGKRTFAIESIRPGKDDPSQRVVKGRSAVTNGHFAVVFGGRPQIFFWTPKEKVEDPCWY